MAASDDLSVIFHTKEILPIFHSANNWIIKTWHPQMIKANNAVLTDGLGCYAVLLVGSDLVADCLHESWLRNLLYSKKVGR